MIKKLCNKMSELVKSYFITYLNAPFAALCASQNAFKINTNLGCITFILAYINYLIIATICILLIENISSAINSRKKN